MKEYCLPLRSKSKILTVTEEGKSLMLPLIYSRTDIECNEEAVSLLANILEFISIIHKNTNIDWKQLYQTVSFSKDKSYSKLYLYHTKPTMFLMQ